MNALGHFIVCIISKGLHALLKIIKDAIQLGIKTLQIKLGFFIANISTQIVKHYYKLKIIVALNKIVSDPIIYSQAFTYSSKTCGGVFLVEPAL